MRAITTGYTGAHGVNLNHRNYSGGNARPAVFQAMW